MTPTCPRPTLRQVQHAYSVLLDCCFLCIKEKNGLKNLSLKKLLLSVYGRVQI